MEGFLLPWYEHIISSGRVNAFSQPFSNYTPPYLYLLSAVSLLNDTGLGSAVSLIKLLAVAGAVLMAAATAYLLRVVGAPKAGSGALWVLLLPTVMVNAAGLGQADTFWTAACIVSVAEAVRQRWAPMLVWCGIAVAFKAQAAFIAPFICSLLYRQRVPLPMWSIPPLVYAGAMSPAWLAGWPAYDLVMIYPNQAAWNPSFIGNAANPWSLVAYWNGADGASQYFWVGFVAAGLACAAYFVHFSKRVCGRLDLLWAALLSATIVPFFLPKMHERFFFLADMLAFALAWAARTKQTILIALLVHLSSLLAAAEMFGWRAGAALACLFSATALSMMLRKQACDRRLEAVEAEPQQPSVQSVQG